MKKFILGVFGFLAFTFLLALLATPGVNKGGGSVLSKVIRGTLTHPNGIGEVEKMEPPFIVDKDGEWHPNPNREANPKWKSSVDPEPYSVVDVWLVLMPIFGFMMFIKSVFSVFEKSSG